MAPQDSFIDEEDDTCPLCVEEFDLSDKSFRPCPCGYQVCQFCFNNIKNNMNGLCPACRRPYSEETMVFKVVTPEEVAKFKADVQKNAKKKAEQRQKEAQKREVESLNRKHLAGLRVIQKNLVYVLGLSPGIREDEMLQTLRGEKYFGQYGKIIKIVVQKAKQGETAQNGQSIGVYVTFDRKEDAARCIAAVNGSQNGDRVLRAQLGTTKYCSAYLRNETCTNKQCMFLHEPGDNDDSYSRQDLSSINSVNTQRPLTTMPSSSRSSSRQAAQFQAPLQQAQPVAAASQPMARGNSKEGSDSGDGSALPSSASWANQIPQQRSRRGSHVTSGATSSPAVSNVLPFTTEAAEEPQKPSEDQQEPQDDVAASSEPTSTALPEPDRNSTLQELLKAINSPLVTFPKIGTKDLDPDFPPLFDDRGGEKRRAIREQEEARLHLEQESQADMQSVEEPVEEEEQQMSGSLQLGGEPEDNHGREGSQVSGFNNSRRLSTQLPIQRASNGAPFGASLAQIQNHGNPTINGRTLTPQQQQQLQLLKSGQSQHGFADQLPHGAGQNSAFFQQQQGQGHNRQSSRYNFVTESSSTSSSVKPSANPKMMAQQAAMMPSGNYAQSNNQFYGTSMQGPPPGLKSTGTPPIGGMFGQGRGFGGSIGGSSVFGGSQTDSNSDMLRDMLRGRGGISAGSSQVHDTGKREYMFPSFLQQYPPASSTPAPAPGLLASLYGHQPGAFHDFGPKQKKKGKKHRHANTSSSGGGGLVDLADPSILQARMQHQQQSNAGVGQGLFGGQAQEDQLLPSLGEMELAVDQVVAENSFDDIMPPTFDLFSRISRSSTPSVPPGFGPPGLTLPHGHPSPVARESPIAKPSSRIVPNAPPFTPKTSSAFLPRASTPLSTVSVPPTPTQQVATPKIFETSPSQAKENVKVLATNSGLSKAIASQASASVGTTQPTTLQSEDFPALEKGSAKQISSSKAATPLKGNSAKKVPTGPSSSTSTAQPVAKSIESRSTPGILNISVPLKGSTKVNAPETPAKSIVSQAAFPALPPSTPVAAQVNAPRPPKTLRVVPTPKNEVPPGSATPSSTTSMFPPLFPSSRQPSLASASRLDRPGTPTSEIISETASITSASLSRASSPPPSKVGSAPVRTTTKSMQKKQRREAQREKEKSELESVVAKPEPEVEIAPIMGRKKKQRKEKPISSATGGSPPIASRATSPSFVETTKDVEVVVAQPSQATEKQASAEQDTNRPPGKIHETKGKGKVKVQRAMSPEPVSMVAEVEEEPVETPNPTPSSVFQELLSEGLIPEVSKLNFVKTPVTFNTYRHESTIDMQDIDQKLIITKEDRSELLSGKPVHKIQDGASRLMLTPNGECIRNLSPEEEERYLDLQARIASDIGPTTFLCEKHNANNGFQLIKGRAVPNGPPAFFPLNNNNGTPIDPVSKIQRDEALSYINQYVLPSLAENPQLEHALNANSLDADLNRGPHEHSSWSSWRTDVEFPHSESGESPYGPSSQEGILATGLENMTHHFAVGREVDRTQQIGNVSLLSLENADAALQKARKETEGIEKTLNRLVKKNRKLLMVTGH